MRIGIDVGGTKAVVAAVDEAGRILRKERIATGENASCREIIRRLRARRRRWRAARKIFAPWA